MKRTLERELTNLGGFGAILPTLPSFGQKTSIKTTRNFSLFSKKNISKIVLKIFSKLIFGAVIVTLPHFLTIMRLKLSKIKLRCRLTTS